MWHSQSECYVTAMKMEAALVSSKIDGGIEKALDRVVSAERRAFICGLKCMALYLKQEGNSAHDKLFTSC